MSFREFAPERFLRAVICSVVVIICVFYSFQTDDPLGSVVLLFFAGLWGVGASRALLARIDIDADLVRVYGIVRSFSMETSRVQRFSQKVTRLGLTSLTIETADGGVKALPLSLTPKKRSDAGTSMLILNQHLSHFQE